MTDAIYRSNTGAYNKIVVMGTILYFSYNRLIGVVKEGKAYINRDPNWNTDHTTRMERELNFPDGDHRYGQTTTVGFHNVVIEVLSTSKRMVQAEKYLQACVNDVIQKHSIAEFLHKEDHGTPTQS